MMSDAEQSTDDKERYGCTRCKNNQFYVVTDSDGISFLRCVNCGRTVLPNHQSVQSAAGPAGGAMSDGTEQQVTAEWLEGRYFCYAIECAYCGAQIAGAEETNAVGRGNILPIDGEGKALCHDHSEETCFVAAGTYSHGGGVPCDTGRSFRLRDVVTVRPVDSDPDQGTAERCEKCNKMVLYERIDGLCGPCQARQVDPRPRPQCPACNRPSESPTKYDGSEWYCEADDCRVDRFFHNDSEGSLR
jgi:ribosomal protein L32